MVERNGIKCLEEGGHMVNKDVKTLNQALYNGVTNLQKGKALKMLLNKLNRTRKFNKEKIWQEK